jgi:hypothetical protein
MSKQNGKTFRGTATIDLKAHFNAKDVAVFDAAFKAVKGDLSGMEPVAAERVRRAYEQDAQKHQQFTAGCDTVEEFLTRVAEAAIRAALREFGKECAPETRFGNISVRLTPVKVSDE